MPGYILHLTAAQMLLSKLNKTIDRNSFLVGNLLPDTVRNKKVSHFRNPKHFGKRIEYPDLDMFLTKYRHLIHDDSCLGYYYHLYIDRQFFRNYLPSVVTFLDDEGKEERMLECVKWAYIKKSGETVRVERFLSKEYYYGDFTNMNTYLMERYKIPLNLDLNVENPGIEEVNYQDVSKILSELQEYLGVPAEAAHELRVFDLENLLAFLNDAAETWIKENT